MATEFGERVTGAIVNCHDLAFCSAVPAASLAAVLTVAVYFLPAVRFDAGSKIIVFPLHVNVPLRWVVVPLRTSENAACVAEWFIGSLNATRTLVPAATFVAPPAGDTDLI